MNFINILRLLRQYFCAKKLQSQNVIRGELRKALLHKKLMKLTLVNQSSCELKFVSFLYFLGKQAVRTQ